MIRTISPQDMREMERAFLEGTGYPSILLMEHAAQAVVDALSAYAPGGGRVLFVCGNGNNGGDGCAAARLWMQRGGKADVWLLKSPSQMKGDAGVNACLLNSCGASLNVLYNEAPEVPKDCAAIVDALYGTGLSRELSGAALAAVQRMNESGLPVVAADIPSGVDGATGQVLGDAVHARETVTFHRAKHGLLLYPGRAYAGKLTVADIGILPEWDGAQGIDVLEEADARALLPVRPGDGHKGTFGHVLSVAGSEGMAGAATLCARSALRAGAGLVTAACPFAVLNTVQAQAPCATAKVVADGASLDAGAADMLKELAEHKAALAVGPGLGREEGAWLAIEALVKSDIPKVIDADALFLLAKHGGGVGANTVLTPHPGEAARLLGCSVAQIQTDRPAAAQELAERYGCVAVLKGSGTLIAAPGREMLHNPTGNPGLARGGSGDVLAGMLAALLAQGLAPFDAAACAVWLHGAAADRCAARTSQLTMLPHDILTDLADVVKELTGR